MKYTFRCCYLRGGRRPSAGPERPPSPLQELEGGAQSALNFQYIYNKGMQAYIGTDGSCLDTLNSKICPLFQYLDTVTGWCEKSEKQEQEQEVSTSIEEDKYMHTNAYTHVHISTYTHIHTYIHIYIHTYTHTHMHIYIPTYIHTYPYLHIYIQPFKCYFPLVLYKSIRIHVCMLFLNLTRIFSLYYTILDALYLFKFLFYFIF